MTEFLAKMSGAALLTASVVLLLWTHCRWQTLTGVGIMTFMILGTLALKDD
jgi:hypothetical protein